MVYVQNKHVSGVFFPDHTLSAPIIAWFSLLLSNGHPDFDSPKCLIWILLLSTDRTSGSVSGVYSIETKNSKNISALVSTKLHSVPNRPK